MNEIKNIVCIGCSHTDGILGGLKYKSTYLRNGHITN